jgi:5-methyltetrahydrofolate--homocysteine methyltransferase
MLIASGIDAVIADPLDRRLMAALRASLALTGRDAHCRDYLRSYREGKLREE